MTIIYRTQANRITIAEAKRLILENLPKELCGSVYARITPDGDIDWDGPVNVIEEAVVMAEPFIDRDFPVMLEQMKTEPMMRYRPAIKGYPESKTMEAEYTIAHDEFCRVADGYQLLVQIGEAAPPPHALEHETATPAPVVASEWVMQAQTRAKEIVKESRARDFYPSQENLGDQIASEFRKAGITGADGKPLSGATIKRHALKGISSATGKQLSTTIGRGK